MKTFILILFLGLPVFANQNNKTEENLQMSRILEAVLNQIQASNINFQLEGSIEKDKGLQLDLLDIRGQLKFKENVEFLWTTNNNKASSSDSSEKLIPKFGLGTKELILDANFSQRKLNGLASVNFYSRYDQATKQWVAKPLVIHISNQLNTQLIVVHLHSITLKFDQKQSNNYTFNGICKSDKQLLDFKTGKLNTKEVKCEFSGYFNGKDGYQVKFKYVD